MRYLTAAILALVLAAPLFADDSVVVTLKDSAAVEKDVVKVSDVAEVTGNPEAAKQVLEVALGSAPKSGEKKTISVDDVKMRLDLAGVDLSSVTFEGAKSVTVVSGANGDSAANEQIIASAAKAALAKKIADAGFITRCEVISVSMRNMLTPSGKIKIEKDPSLPDSADLAKSGALVAVVTVKEQDGYDTAVTVTIQLTAYHKIAVAKTNIQKGDVLTSASVVLEERPETEKGVDVAAAIGKRASAHIPAGSALTENMLEDTPVVKKGEIVRVTVKREGLSVMFYGRSKDDGANGVMVEVANSKTGKTLFARVTGRGEAEVSDNSERRGE